MFKAGFQFAPGFRIQKFLGRGQFGQVWQVAAPGGTLAAVKFIDLSDTDGQKEFEGVKRVKQIRQANLMPITAIWKLDEHGKAIDELPDPSVETQDLSAIGAAETVQIQPHACWLAVAMLLGGESLDKQLRQRADDGAFGIAIDQLISYMQDVAKGLDFLNQRQHDLGNGLVAIQHCDVKPSNIVTIGNSAVICDFGLAKILNRNQATATSAAGTPHYMAPEAIMGEPSLTSDQYSLAVTYYHLRTGQLPASGGSVWAILDAHRKGQLNFDLVPPAEEDVLVRATELDWNKRFGSCAELVDALRDATRGIAMTAPISAADPAVTQDFGSSDFSLDHDSTGADSRQREERFKRRTIAGWSIVGVVAVTIGLIALRPWNRTPRTDGLPSQSGLADPLNISVSELLSDVLADFDRDEASAVHKFKTIKNDSVAADPIALVLQTQEAIQRVILGRSANSDAEPDTLVAVGISPTAIAFPMPTLGDDGYSVIGSLNGKSMFRNEGPLNRNAIVSSADRRRLLVGGMDYLTMATILAAEGIDPLKLEGPTGESLAVAWNKSGSLIVSAHDGGQLAIWEIQNDQRDGGIKINRTQSLSTEWTAKSMLSDSSGRWLVVVTQQGDVRLIDWGDIVAALEVKQELKSNSIKARGTAANVVDFVSIDSPSAGRRIPCVAVGGDQGEVTLWKLPDATDNGAERIEPQLVNRDNTHETYIETLNVANWNGSPIIVSSASDGMVSVWQPDAPHAERVNHKFGDEAIVTAAVSIDGRWIVLGNLGGEVWLWDWVTIPEKPLLVGKCSSFIDHILIGPYDDLLIAASDDETIRVWNFRHLKLLALTGNSIHIKSKTPIDQKTPNQVANQFRTIHSPAGCARPLLAKSPDEWGK